MHRLCSPGVRRIVRGNARNPQANVRLAVGADGVFDEMRQEMGGRVGSISGHGLGFCEGQRGLDSVGCLRRAMFCWLVCGKNERNHLSIVRELVCGFGRILLVTGCDQYPRQSVISCVIHGFG